jgi:hypothetical protein
VVVRLSLEAEPKHFAWVDIYNYGIVLDIYIYFCLYLFIIYFNFNIRMYKTIILPVVQYGRETWSLTLREEHRLEVFENRVLRRIFGPKRDEVIGEWRRLHNEELHDLLE